MSFSKLTPNQKLAKYKELTDQENEIKKQKDELKKHLIEMGATETKDYSLKIVNQNRTTLANWKDVANAIGEQKLIDKGLLYETKVEFPKVKKK